MSKMKRPESYVLFDSTRTELRPPEGLGVDASTRRVAVVEVVEVRLRAWAVSLLTYLGEVVVLVGVGRLDGEGVIRYEAFGWIFVGVVVELVEE
jgi:hypothetical protein